MAALANENDRAPLKQLFSSTPVRVNDLGGWTDTWFSGEGRVLNVAVKPGIEVEVDVFENVTCRPDRVHVHAVSRNVSFRIDPDHPTYETEPLIEGALNLLPVPTDRCLDITIRSSVPPGSSTGTSGSLCVALLGALDVLQSKPHSSREIARLAHKVEAQKLGLQSGIQDQLCAAGGGISFITMHSYPEAEVDKIALSPDLLTDLDASLCLIYLGGAHSSTALHEEVIARLEAGGSGASILKELCALAEAGRDALIHGDLAAYGQAMKRNHACQKALHPALISERAAHVVAVAEAHNAMGWKVNGAGGEGGSISVLGSLHPAKRDAMLKTIEKMGQGIRPIPISIADQGLCVRS